MSELEGLETDKQGQKLRYKRQEPNGTFNLGYGHHNNRNIFKKQDYKANEYNMGYLAENGINAVHERQFLLKHRIYFSIFAICGIWKVVTSHSERDHTESTVGLEVQLKHVQYSNTQCSSRLSGDSSRSLPGPSPTATLTTTQHRL